MNNFESSYKNPSLQVVKQGGLATASQFTDEVNDEEINLLEYWLVIKRRGRAILGLAFVMALVGLLIAFTITPQYKSTIKILVEPNAPKVVSLDPLQGMNNILFFYETQYEIIASRSVAETVVKNLKLEQHPVFIKITSKLSQKDSDNSAWRNLISDAQPKANNLAVENQFVRNAVIESVLENLNVKGQKKSQIINISYESPDAKLSALIANAVAQAYIEKGLESKLALNQNAAQWLNNRLSGLRQKLEKSENALRIYQQKESMVNTKSFASIASGKLGGITEALIKAQAARAEAEIRYQQVKDIGKGGKKLTSLPIVLSNKFIQTLKAGQAKLAREVSELSERYGYKHPKMIAAKADLRIADRRLQEEVTRVIDGVHRDYEVAVANVNQLKSLSQQTQAESRGDQSKTFELAKLERDVATNHQLFEVFMTRYKETSMTGDNGVTNVSIVDFARPALYPSKPKKKLIIAAAIFAGLFLGVLLAFLLEYLENTFRIPEDVEHKLGLPLLGVLPILSLEDKSDISPERYSFAGNSSSVFTEALNNIRTGVMFANIDTPAKMIMVTSSVANEGKTTLSSNLSLTFSHTGKTLLIDGDLRKQQFSKDVLSQKRIAGLAELTAGDVSLDECIVADSQVDNLFYMSSGLTTPKPLELLSSKKFADLLLQLREKFDHIIIDSAPVLPVSDSLVLGHLVDEVILVVKADSTTHKMAQDAVKRLATAHVQPLGVVLQLADLEKMENYGGYYYGYGYGDVYGAEKSEQTS